jgi:hypothetical protein
VSRGAANAAEAANAAKAKKLKNFVWGSERAEKPSLNAELN